MRRQIIILVGLLVILAAVALAEEPIYINVTSFDWGDPLGDVTWTGGTVERTGNNSFSLHLETVTFPVRRDSPATKSRGPLVIKVKNDSKVLDFGEPLILDPWKENLGLPLDKPED